MIQGKSVRKVHYASYEVLLILNSVVWLKTAVVWFFLLSDRIEYIGLTETGPPSSWPIDWLAKTSTHWLKTSMTLMTSWSSTGSDSHQVCVVSLYFTRRLCVCGCMRHNFLQDLYDQVSFADSSAPRPMNKWWQGLWMWLSDQSGSSIRTRTFKCLSYQTIFDFSCLFACFSCYYSSSYSKPI